MKYTNDVVNDLVEAMYEDVNYVDVEESVEHNGTLYFGATVYLENKEPISITGKFQIEEVE